MKVRSVTAYPRTGYKSPEKKKKKKKIKKKKSAVYLLVHIIILKIDFILKPQKYDKFLKAPKG